MRILVVDDDDSIREFVGMALEDEGHQVVTAAQGAQALVVAAESPPDLILLDIRMPVMDGWEFARLYRQQPGPHAPIVVLSATGNPAATMQQIGAMSFLAKPFELKQLLALVEDYCQG